MYWAIVFAMLCCFSGQAAGVNLDIADYIGPSMEEWLMIIDMMYMCVVGSGEMDISAI